MPLPSDFRWNPLWSDSAEGSLLRELSGELHDLWLPDHSLGDRSPTIIYHYTTNDGLLGILKSNRIWATDLNYMNDTSELNYARDLIRQVLIGHGSAAVDPTVKSFYDGAVSMLTPPGIRRFFAVCFCECGDLLSQWRAYGAHGGGVAIGLRTQHIGYRSKLPLCIRKVMYDPGRQRELVEMTVERTERLLTRLVNGQAKEAIDRIFERIAHFLDDHLSEYAFVFKNPGFREEREWRVTLPIFGFERREEIQALHFRSSGNLLIPYVKLDVSPLAGYSSFQRLPIERIVFGPTVDAGLTSAALRDVLEKYDYHLHVSIVASDIPLRA